MCLHQLFQRGVIKAVTREVTREGVKFHIWADKVNRGRWGWNLTGTRSRLSSRSEVMLALELAEKHKNNVRRIRL